MFRLCSELVFHKIFYFFKKMFFFFLILHLIKSKNSTPMVGDKQFKKIIKTNQIVIALIIHENESDFWNQTQKFSDFPKIAENATYVVITNENAPKTFNNYRMLETCLSFFINGTAYFACKMPETEEGITHVIKTSILNETSTVKDMNEFRNYYKQFEYTIITTKEKEEEARILYIRHTFSRGPLGFCVFNKQDFGKYFQHINKNNNEFVLYRSKEDVFESFDGTDLTLNKAYEYYVNYQIEEENLYKSDKLFVLPIGNFTGKNIDLLRIAKQKHDNYQYGYLTNESYSILKPLLDAININETKSPYITVINSTSFYAFTPLLSNFSINSILNYLNKIENGKIQRIYASEPIPENEIEIDEQTNKTSKIGLYKLVGKTYEKFLKDDNNDDVIIYCGNYQTDFKEKVFKIIKYLDDNEINGIRIAYIYSNNNSSPIGFPLQLSQPHVELFPAKKHQQSVPYVGSLTIYSLLQFLNTNGTINVDVNVSLIENDVEKQTILANIFNVATYHNEKFRILSEEYAERIGKIIGLGENISAISDALIAEENAEEEKQQIKHRKHTHKHFSKHKKSHKSYSESSSSSSSDSDSSSDNDSEITKQKIIKKKENRKIKNSQLLNSTSQTEETNSTSILDDNETINEINETETNVTESESQKENNKKPKKQHKRKSSKLEHKKHKKSKAKKTPKVSEQNSTNINITDIPEGISADPEEEARQEL